MKSWINNFYQQVQHEVLQGFYKGLQYVQVLALNDDNQLFVGVILLYILIVPTTPTNANPIRYWNRKAMNFQGSTLRRRQRQTTVALPGWLCVNVRYCEEKRDVLCCDGILKEVKYQVPFLCISHHAKTVLLSLSVLSSLPQGRQDGSILRC